MSNRIKRSLLTLVVVIYFGLLMILPIVERGNPDASITSIKDAIWFSIVTITTVGYGDFYPVSAIGRVIGIFYILMSVGLLAYMVGFITSQLNSKMTPRLIVSLTPNRPKYIFSDMNEYAITLAKDVYHHKERTGVPILIFTENKDVVSEALLSDIPHYKLSSGAIKSLIQSHQAKHVSYIGFSDDEYANTKNIDILSQTASLNCNFYYNSRFLLENNTTDHIPQAFSLYQTSARYYWKTFELGFNENNIVIIGFDHFAKQLLLQALLVNVLDVDSKIKYHIFCTEEQRTNFLAHYPMLTQFIDIDVKALTTNSRGNTRENINNIADTTFPAGASDITRDTIIFHHDLYLNQEQFLQKADRIIVTHDQDSMNHQVYQSLVNRYTSLNIHVRSFYSYMVESSLNTFVFWGSLQDICTKDLIIKEKLNETAKEIHNYYSRQYDGGSWEELSSLHKNSNIAQADHIANKLRILSESDNTTQDFLCHIEHIRWSRFMYLNNWTYNATRCNEKRQHNLLTDYAALTKEDAMKNFDSWTIIDEVRKTD